MGKTIETVSGPVTEQTPSQIMFAALQMEREARLAAELRANTDGLTGLPNRRKFSEELDKDFHRAQRTGIPITVIMLDADRFKLVNDKEGHAAGDLVLQKIAAILKDHHRTEDTVGRLGGEEFAVILYDCPQAYGTVFADKIRHAIEESSVDLRVLGPGRNADFKFTASFGVATFDSKTDRTPEMLMNRVDEALYDAKNNGRNCVSTWQAPHVFQHTHSQTKHPLPVARSTELARLFRRFALDSAQVLRR